jgi:seryl-tRNA synthetase
MLDLNFIRERPDEVKEALVRLNTTAPIDAILELDEKRREMIKEVEALRAKRNDVSKQIGRMKDDDERESLITGMRETGDRIKDIDEQLRQTENALNRLLFEVPNMPHPEVPVGPDESANVVVRDWGEIRRFDFKPLPHWELGENLGIIDFERGVKLSGSRFYVLRGLGARLQRALIAWMIDLHVFGQGYTEVYTPFVVREECMWSTGQMPKFGDNLYRDIEDDLWLIPTAEVPVTNLYMDEILEADQLPINHVAYSPCFRREKMSAGKETRGLKRGHQFDKVEMVKFCTPDSSDEEMDRLTDNAEEVCRELKLPYRVVQMCTGDLSFTAAIKYDIELWAGGCEEWLEVSSCSNFRDFQARRANIRYRPQPRSKPEFVHTLNGSGLGMPRVMIAVLENYQQEDGSILVPDVLRPYMQGIEVIQ